jgi:DNA-binding NtrC family response regulator
MAVILIIDDEESIRAMLSEYLTERGYDVISAENGKRALSILADRRIDLIITDIIMEDKDGVEVIRSLRQTLPGLPVIAMSGGAHLPADFYLDMAHGLGAFVSFKKPFINREMLAAVERCLEEVKNGKVT